MTAPKILAISSFVSSGTVGLRAIGPALSALQCEAMEVPTVLLSNHPGHAHVAGQRLDPPLISRIIGALDANGWFSDATAVLTGYLPSSGHVECAQSAVSTIRARNPAALYVLDPILGDDPGGLYIEESAAVAVRDGLVGLANLLTPNRFELAWLTGRTVTCIDDAIDAARTLSLPVVVATSIPAPDGQLATVLVSRDTALPLYTAKRDHVPHGTGDLLSGLLTGHLARGLDLKAAFTAAHSVLSTVIARSCGRESLDLSPLTTLANLP